jgi:hypothetical protein
MKQVDILGIGQEAIIFGKKSKREYHGLLFSKNDAISSTFPDNFIIIDIKDLLGDHVTSYHSVQRFKESEYSPNSLIGEYYLILENKPLFGLVLPIDDLTN